MKAFVDWNREAALPLWAERGFDAAAGRFAERLDADMRPLPVPHRAMVQARQIYVYAHAAELGWFPRGAAMAEAAVAALRRDFMDERAEAASVAFSIDPATGRIVSGTRDSYTHAFVLFALAHLYRLNGEAAALRLAERVAAFVERALTDPVHGGVLDEAHAAAGSPKRQNPQMHLLEAYLAWEAAAPGRGWLERADSLVTLFDDRMAQSRQGMLPEIFAADWGMHPDLAISAAWEPGHHYEWAWLLDRHERLSGRESHWRDVLHERAVRDGHAPGGLIFDEVCGSRGVVKRSHRLWPHTEAIKAAVARHHRGDPAALPFARAMAALVAEHFLDAPFPGGWTDRITSGGAPTVDHVPASSLYHLFSAATEAADLDDRAADH